jgi:hypothetical protein
MYRAGIKRRDLREILHDYDEYVRTWTTLHTIRFDEVHSSKPSSIRNDALGDIFTFRTGHDPSVRLGASLPCCSPLGRLVSSVWCSCYVRLLLACKLAAGDIPRSASARCVRPHDCVACIHKSEQQDCTHIIRSRYIQ